MVKKCNYNETIINKSHGLAVYIKEDIKEITQIVQINKLKIIKIKISLNNKEELSISTIYRSHDLHKTKFFMNIKEFKKLIKYIETI